MADLGSDRSSLRSKTEGHAEAIRQVYPLAELVVHFYRLEYDDGSKCNHLQL